MKKDWKKIAGAGNQQLRLSLISAQGEIAEGLSRGFPQYFLAEGETLCLPDRRQLLELVREAGRRDKVLQIIKELGLPHQRLGFSGSCLGTTKGVSYSEGGYDTVACGWGDYFYRSSKSRGDTLEYEGATWLVVWNGFGGGDARSFDRHTLVIVPEEALASS